MIAIEHECPNQQNNWQSSFVNMLPEIEKRLRHVFRHLDADAREDAMEDAVVHGLLSYHRLHQQNRAKLASPSSLAWYASLQVKRGRPAAGRMNGREPLSRYAQIGNGIRVERLPGNWMDMLIEDKRASVADQVAAKIDLTAWFATLTKRMREIAEELALGFTTSEVAMKHGISAGRVSQLRRSLELSWFTFQHESVPLART